MGLPSSPGDTLTLLSEELLFRATTPSPSLWLQDGLWSLSSSRLSMVLTSSPRPPAWLRSPMLMDLERRRLLLLRSESRPASDAPDGKEKEALPDMVPGCGELGTLTP